MSKLWKEIAARVICVRALLGGVGARELRNVLGYGSNMVDCAQQAHDQGVGQMVRCRTLKDDFIADCIF